MSTSTDGILFYGYDLGGPEDDGPAFKDLGEDEHPTWYDPDDEDADFIEAATTALLAAVGFTETDWRADGYHERKKAAEERMGVELDSHCSGEYPMYLLAAKKTTAARGYPKEVDFTLPDNADERLAWAIGVLGLDVGDQKPRWLLASYWG